MDWIIKPENVGGLALSGMAFCENKDKMEKECIKAVLSVCGDKLVVTSQF